MLETPQLFAIKAKGSNDINSFHRVSSGAIIVDTSLEKAIMRRESYFGHMTNWLERWIIVFYDRDTGRWEELP